MRRLTDDRSEFKIIVGLDFNLIWRNTNGSSLSQKPADQTKTTTVKLLMVLNSNVYARVQSSDDRSGLDLNYFISS